MAAELFTLAAVLTLETAKFTQGIRNAKKQSENFASSMQRKLTAGTVAMGNLISSTVQTAGRGMLNLTKNALKLTGDVEQALGGSEAVFGEWAENIQKKAQSAFKSAGLSAGEYLDTANKMGSLLKGSGFVTAEAFEMTEQAMQRASDVASVMGVDVNSAMEAIGGLAKGNFTMMDNLGVAINDTTLGVYALEKGITKSTSKMTTAEKVALAYQMFMERTAQYAGNYAKENDTLNGSLQTLKSSFDNLLTGQGTVDDFVDSVENAARVGVRSLGQIVPRLATGMWESLKKGLPKAKKELSNFWDNDAPGIVTSGANLLIQGVNAFFGTNIPKIEQIELPKFADMEEQVRRWWSGEESFLKSVCNWTLNAFGFPDVDACATGLTNWWEMTKKNFNDSFVWVLEMFGVPDADKGAQKLADWMDEVKEKAEKIRMGEVDFQGNAGQKFNYANPESIHDLNQYNPYGMGGFDYTAWVNGEISDDSKDNMQKQLNSMGLSVPVDVQISARSAVRRIGEIAGNLVSGWSTVLGDMNRGYATGLNYVPYNNFPAALHEGEAVLTRSQAEAWRKGDGQAAVGIDYDRLAAALVQAVGGMSVQMDGHAVGTLVAPTVSKAMGKSANARRYTG